MKVILLLISVITFSDVAYTACDINAGMVSAKYKVSRQLKGADNKQVQHVVLWRNKNQVVHQYQERGISELWEPVTNGKLRLVRYFDQYRRGIEYAPEEINLGAGESDWSLKYQLVSDQLIHKMNRLGSTGTDCEQLVSYALDQGHTSLRLDWLAERKLVKRFHEKTADADLVWELEDVVVDQKQIKQQLVQWANYQTTDYIDIGDNESDPFLMQMINLGFVKHSASGFYDSDGHQLHGQEQHH